MSDTPRPRVPVVAVFFAYAICMRVLPYALHRWGGMALDSSMAAWPWNFSPLYALALLGGATFPRGLGLLAPIAAQAASDLLIAAIAGPEWAFYSGQAFVYLAMGATAAWGLPLRNRCTPLPIGLAACAGGMAFFLISNGGVWLTGGGWSRPHTLAGLLTCYADGWPFYRPTVLSLLLFVPVCFSPLCLSRPAALRWQTA